MVVHKPNQMPVYFQLRDGFPGGFVGDFELFSTTIA